MDEKNMTIEFKAFVDIVLLLLDGICEELDDSPQKAKLRQAIETLRKYTD